MADLGLDEARTDSNWRSSGACKDLPNSLFFASRPGLRARAACERCPVRQQCQQFGMTQEYGFWGGLSEGDRERIRNGDQPEQAVINHATYSGYQAGCRLKCCKEAKRLYVQERRLARSA